MSYRELSKLYFEDKDAYTSTYVSRFNSADTIRLSFNIKNYPVFFVQNAEVSDIVFQILQADKKISLLSTQLPAAALSQYRKKCLIDEIVLTNKIESVYSTRREIESILSDLENAVNRKNRKKRFQGLVRQYYMLDANERRPLQSCEDIRRLYDELVLAEVVGENQRNKPDGKLFRKDSASVHSVTDREIHRGAYPESAIIKELGEALAFLNDKRIFFLYRIMIFHYLLEYVHPFYDGNGRLGRFIVSAYLSQEVHPLLAYRISYTITENINHYYNAFKICNDRHSRGDVTPFLIMMLNMVHLSASRLADALHKRRDQLLEYCNIIYKLPGGDKPRTHDIYYQLIQAGLFSENGVSTKALEQYLGNSYTTIKKELDSIDGHGLLTKTRVERENHYRLDLEKINPYLTRE